MRKDVARLIADIRLAYDDVCRLLDNEDEKNLNQLPLLDRKLQKSFDALLSADLSDVDEKVQRICYMVEQIRKHTDGCEFVGKLTSSILTDVLSLAKQSEEVTRQQKGAGVNDRTLHVLARCS